MSNRYRFETEADVNEFLTKRAFVLIETNPTVTFWRRDSWHAWVRRQKNGRYLVEIL